MIAAPMPCTARAVFSIAMSRREAHATEATVKSDEADDEQPLAAEPVGEEAGGEHDARQRERVRVDDPLQAAEARVRGRRRCRESAVLTTAMSSMSMAVAAQTTTSVQRWFLGMGREGEGGEQGR